MSTVPNDPARHSQLGDDDPIEAHLRFLRAAGASAKTLISRERLLRVLHAWLTFGLLYADTDELEWWLQHDPRWSAWTKSTYAMHIRGFYKWASGRAQLINDDPSAEMARPRTPASVPHPVTDDQLAIALRRSPQPWLMAINLASYAGLRISELCGVHREHVTEQTIRIVCAKGGDPATVDCHPVIWELVRSRPLGPLCVHPDGRPLTARWINGHGRAHFDAIGLPDVTMHRFRHWFGTALLEGGADLRTVQEAMRHKSIMSTQGYTKVSGSRRRQAVQSLPVIDPDATS